MSLMFCGTVDAIGRIRFDSPELAAAELSKLAGKRVRVEIKREVHTRSIQQNKLMWAIYGEAVAEGTDFVELATGAPVFRTREDVHGFAKLALLRRPVITNRGEINMLGSTTTLTTDEHSKYIELLCAKLSNLGIYVPPAVGR